MSRIVLQLMERIEHENPIFLEFGSGARYTLSFFGCNGPSLRWGFSTLKPISSELYDEFEASLNREESFVCEMSMVQAGRVSFEMGVVVVRERGSFNRRNLSFVLEGPQTVNAGYWDVRVCRFPLSQVLDGTILRYKSSFVPETIEL